MFFLFLIIGLVAYATIGLLLGNQIKIISPWIYLLVAALVGVIGLYLTESYKYEDREFGGICFIAAGIIAMIALISFEKRKEDADQLKYEAEKKEEEERQKEAERKYKADLDSLASQYGEITKSFNLGNKTKEDSICVFESTKSIWILGKVYDFDKIINCSLSDNDHIEKAEVVYKTSTSTGSMIGRAVVGGILTGGVGAVVGGATAAKKTVAVPQGEDKIIHDYSVIINVDDLSAPIIHIPCKADKAMAEGIYAILSVIIKRNGNV